MVENSKMQERSMEKSDFTIQTYDFFQKMKYFIFFYYLEASS